MWVQKELEILEKAGVTVRSVSPWASPIVIVPKEQPRRTSKGDSAWIIMQSIVYYLL